MGGNGIRLMGDHALRKGNDKGIAGGGCLACWEKTSYKSGLLCIRIQNGNA